VCIQKQGEKKPSIVIMHIFNGCQKRCDNDWCICAVPQNAPVWLCRL